MNPLILWLALSMQKGWDKAKPHVKSWCERHLIADYPYDEDEEIRQRIEKADRNNEQQSQDQAGDDNGEK